MSTTTNLNLELFEKGIDPDQSFEQLRLNLNGETDSNMTKVDDYVTTFGGLLSVLTLSTLASFATLTSTTGSMSGSITNASGSIAEITTRFDKLDEFSGSGTANFDGISGSYTHLILMGTVAVSLSGCPIANLGIDFNADSGSTNYSSVQWKNSGSRTGTDLPVPNETIEIYDTSQVVIGKVSASPLENLEYSNFFAIVPFYSGSSALWKTAMGFSMAWTNNYISTEEDVVDWFALSNQGGYWKSTAPITRIRVFGSLNNLTRHGFHTGTKISLYGLL